jgi:nucleotide-binding universal stress UspA family protein
MTKIPSGPDIRTILLPVDFSGRSLVAARYAQGLAGHFQAGIKILHVLPPPHYEAMSLEVSGPALAELLAHRGEAAEARMSNFLANELAGLTVERHVVEGDPGAVIANAAGPGTLIVMPTHGYGPFRRFILGSVTAKVLHDAHVPVLTGVHLEDFVDSGAARFTRVLAAVDLGPQSDAVLAWAAGFARTVGATLTVMHVAPSIEGELGEYFDPNWRETFARPVRERLARSLKTLEAEAELQVAFGDPAKQVAEAAQAIKADLVVIGRGQTEGGLGRLRTHSYSIIRSAPCAVVSV